MLPELNEAAEAILRYLSESEAQSHAEDLAAASQYAFDLEADAIAVEMLRAAGYGVLSEESGLHNPDADIWVIVDPIDGSRNLAAGVPYYGPSLCAVDADGPVAAVVHNVASDTRFTAERGRGAFCNGRELSVPRRESLEQALVCTSIDVPLDRETLRNFGAAAHELCLVADGSADAFVGDPATQRSWDIAAGALIVVAAGGTVITSTPLVRGNRELLDTLHVLAATSRDFADEIAAGMGYGRIEPVASQSQFCLCMDVSRVEVSGGSCVRSDPGPDTIGIGVSAPSIVHETGFPQYAYGVLQAANLAKRLDLGAITALELGVAGGNGLLELERLSDVIGRQVQVEIRSAGFDLGSGMPEPVDHRDLPYMWQRGFFAMDEQRLRSRLSSASLILGEVSETGPAFMSDLDAPIGFISFDLDYYSSTAAAMEALLNHDASHYLPRVFCYFDDTVGPHEELHSEFAGELLAIREFNDSHEHRKIAKVNGLRYKLLPYEGAWVSGFYVLHLFDHEQYNQYVYPEPDRQFPLEA